MFPVSIIACVVCVIGVWDFVYSKFKGKGVFFSVLELILVWRLYVI